MDTEGQAPADARYLVSTICRGSGPGEPSGHLYVVDPQRGVQSSCPVPPCEHLHREPNPRGGIRGGRGLATDGDTVYVANGSEVLRFDRSWRQLAMVSHPWCGNVHDIGVAGDRLWVCSTANDALASFDTAGRLDDLIDLRPSALLSDDGTRFAAAIDYRDPADYRLEESNLLHANGIGFGTDGVPLVSLGRVETGGSEGAHSGLIARADGLGLPVQVATGVKAPIHNVLPLADGSVLTLDTGAGTLLVLRADGTVAKSVVLAAPAPHGFLRGICVAGRDRLLIGERNRILAVDLDLAQSVGELVLSAAPSEAVYAIAPLPAGFEPLPLRLSA